LNIRRMIILLRIRIFQVDTIHALNDIFSVFETVSKNLDWMIEE